MSDRKQYSFTIDFTKPEQGQAPDAMYRAFLESMTSAEPLGFAYRDGNQTVEARVKIVGVRDVAPGRYEVTAEDAEQ